MERRLFTSESVTDGHPDKICDQISDAILDAILAEDREARVACETAVTTGLILIMGEITTNCYVEIPKIAREVVKEIGYTRAKYGFDGDTCSVLTAIDEQSPDIALGVNQALEVKTGAKEEENTLGAGDQGMVFGYATDETPEFMPMPIALAHRLARRLAYVRKNKILPMLRPDGKTQVTVEYEGDRPLRIENIVVSAQHNPNLERSVLEEGIREEVIKAVIPAEYLDAKTKYYINPTGRFVVGGPQGDAGLTGRKIIVDTYGGMARHGGGAFRGRIRRKWTGRVPTPPVTWPKTLWPPVWPGNVRFRLLMRSGWPNPFRLPSILLGPGSYLPVNLRNWCRRSLICAQRRSLKTWTCAGRSIAKPPVTGILAVWIWTCLGKGWTRLQF